jgi:hypothetical protein
MVAELRMGGVFTDNPSFILGRRDSGRKSFWRRFERRWKRFSPSDDARQDG